jgi:hypothetical protein
LYFLKDVLEKISNIAIQHGYKIKTYSNHLIIYGSEFQADVTVIDDNVIIVETRGFPEDRIQIMKVEDLMEKPDEEISSLLGMK